MTTTSSPFRTLKGGNKTLQKEDNILDKLKGVPFFCGNLSRSCGEGCAWDVLGRPWKNGIQHPLYPAQQIWTDILLNNIPKVPLWKQSHLCLLSSRGAGKSEVMLRIIAHLATRNNDLVGTEVVIATGNRIELGVALCGRLKAMLKYQVPDTKETQCIINDCKVNVYPAQHSQAIRGVERCSVAWSDEAGSYPIGQAREVRAIFEGFIAKSNPVIAFTGTPGHHNDLLFQMLEEDDNESIYQRIKQDYTYSKLYSEEDIIRAKRSKSWAREMALSYGIGLGTMCNNAHIDRCIVYNPTPLDISSSIISIGIDPAYSGSADGSKFAISALSTNPATGKARILVSKQYSGLSNSQSINIVVSTLQQLGFTPVDRNRFRVFVDSANPGTISDIKPMFQESSNWSDINYMRDLATKNNLKLSDLMLVVPVPFNSDGLTMLQKLQTLVSDGMLEIPNTMQDLILQLRISRLKPNQDLDKTQPSDLIDSLRLALNYVSRYDQY